MRVKILTIEETEKEIGGLLLFDEETDTFSFILHLSARNLEKQNRESGCDGFYSFFHKYL